MLTATLAVLGLLALRVGVPIAATALLCRLLGRLDARWSGTHATAA